MYLTKRQKRQSATEPLLFKRRYEQKVCELRSRELPFLGNATSKERSVCESSRLLFKRRYEQRICG